MSKLTHLIEQSLVELLGVIEKGVGPAHRRIPCIQSRQWHETFIAERITFKQIVRVQPSDYSWVGRIRPGLRCLHANTEQVCYRIAVDQHRCVYRSPGGTIIKIEPCD